jgi:hypothetical protein
LLNTILSIIKKTKFRDTDDKVKDDVEDTNDKIKPGF